MKANELRIGNWVEYDNRIFAIHTIADEFPTLDTEEFGIGVVDWNNINPIPITPEWLEKLGFSCDEECNEFSISDGYEFIIGKNKNSKTWFCFQIKMDGFMYFEHVHQLQNLYHALTGREL